MTLSANSSVRNFTLAQQTTYYTTRLRTTSTSVNGTPSLSTASGTLTTQLTHVVYTRSHPSGNTKTYINGVQVATGSAVSSFSNWDTGFKFALANELTMNRTWLGELHLEAIYDRPLSASEVSQNFSAEPKGTTPAMPTPTPTPTLTPWPVGTRVSDDVVVLYELEEGSGTTVNDTSGVGTPLNLTVENAGAVSWVSGGLSISSSTIVKSASAATKIINSVMATNEISIEGWVKPANTSQSGPSRIVTLSANSSVRNFTLGQSGSYYNTRLRSTSTSVNGTPSLSTPSGSLTTVLTHVVFTRDTTLGTTRTYINGSQVSSGNTPSSFSNWDQSFKFALANELTMNRTWLGELHLVAIYSRELTASEVTQNFNAGPKGVYQTPTPTPTPVAVQAPTGMVAWWPGDGNTENLVSGGPDGTLRNGATFAQGKVSQAFTLDGSNDHVEVADFGNFTIFSVDTWVFRNGGTASRESIVSYKEGNSPNCGFVLSLNENGSSHRPRLWVRVNSQWKYAEGSTGVPLNSWTFLTGTYDGQTIRMYVNGVEVDSTSASGSLTQCSQKTGIGSRASLNQHFFPGLIDEVEIFDRALSASEVQSIYTADSKGKVKPTATPTPTPTPTSRVPGSGVRGRGSGERETTASSLAGKEESSRKEDNSGQGKDGPAGAIAQGGNGR